MSGENEGKSRYRAYHACAADPCHLSGPRHDTEGQGIGYHARLGSSDAYASLSHCHDDNLSVPFRST